MNKMTLHVKWVFIKLVLLIGICLSITSCYAPVKNDHSQTPVLKPTTTEKIGILPFSKFVSESVRAKIGVYYKDIERELVNILQKKGVSVTLIQYPADQEPFTYEEMEAPSFDIDADDFATPEQILSEISSQGEFDKVIFGHLEEISDSLYLVVRVYSKADSRVEPALLQIIEIDTASLTVAGVKTKIEKLAEGISNDERDSGLFGIDP